MSYKGVKNVIPSALPEDYDRQRNFTSWQAANPGAIYPGADLDAEFNEVERSIDETQDRLTIIQNSDGSLKNDSVGLDQLKAEAQALFLDFNFIGNWETATAYVIDDGVWESNKLYRCIVAHTSGVFATDLAADKWELLVDIQTWVPETIVDAAPKATPVDSDMFGYVDTEAANALVRFTWANIKATLLSYFFTGPAIKATPVDADTFAYIDTEAANIPKKLTWANVKATLLSYFTTGAATKATPVDADIFGYIDTQAANIPKKFTWANIKATLLSYFFTGAATKAAPADADIFGFIDTEAANIPKKFTWADIKGFLDDKEYCAPNPTGTPLTVAGTGVVRICKLNSTDIAFIDNVLDELRLYRYDLNAGTWSLVGSGLSIPSTGGSAITGLNSTDIALLDATNELLSLYRHNGSTWSLIGTPLSIAGIGALSLTALNATDVAFIDNTLDELRTYRFSAGPGTWAQVGSGLALGNAAVAICALSSTDVALIDSAFDELRRYTFSGSAWSLVGSGMAYGGAGISIPYMAALNANEIIMYNTGDDELRCYKWSNSTWAPSRHALIIGGGGESSVLAFSDSHVVIYNNVTDQLVNYQYTKELGRHGFYTGLFTGTAATVYVPLNYSIIGNHVTLTSPDNSLVVSNSTALTITGAPTIIRPKVNDGAMGFCILASNAVATRCEVRMLTTGVLSFSVGGVLTGFNVAGNKGFMADFRMGYTYSLNPPG
jgi:hypothetical protein